MTLQESPTLKKKETAAIAADPKVTQHVSEGQHGPSSVSPAQYRRGALRCTPSFHFAKTHIKRKEPPPDAKGPPSLYLTQVGPPMAFFCSANGRYSWSEPMSRFLFRRFPVSTDFQPDRGKASHFREIKLERIEWLPSKSAGARVRGQFPKRSASSVRLVCVSSQIVSHSTSRRFSASSNCRPVYL